MDKPVLFFSQNCPNSRKLGEYLGSLNMLDAFVKICVDNNNKIPPFINSVPSIFVPQSKQVLTNQSVLMFVNSLKNSVQRQPNNSPFQQQTQMQQQAQIQQQHRQQQQQATQMQQQANMSEDQIRQATQGSNALITRLPSSRMKEHEGQQKNEVIEGVKAWHPGDMDGSFSDSYSYITEAVTPGIIGHSFEFLNGETYGRPDILQLKDSIQNRITGGANGGGNMAQNNSLQNNKKGGSDLDKRYQELLNSRR